jgi:hypothetical protein
MKDYRIRTCYLKMGPCKSQRHGKPGKRVLFFHSPLQSTGSATRSQIFLAPFRHIRFMNLTCTIHPFTFKTFAASAFHMHAGIPVFCISVAPPLDIIKQLFPSQNKCLVVSIQIRSEMACHLCNRRHIVEPQTGFVSCITSKACLAVS